MDFDLRPYINTSLLDINSNFFTVFDLPDKFGIGKNYFRLRVNNSLLVKGTYVFINIINSAGIDIGYEVPNIRGEDNSRIIVVDIPKDTPEGPITIMIGGTTNGNSNVNVIWMNSYPLTVKDINQSRIIFKTPPEVEITERNVIYKKKINSDSVRINKPNTLGIKLSLAAPQLPIEFSGQTKFPIDTLENNTTNQVDSTTENKIFSTIDGNETVIFNKSNETRNIPEYHSLPVIQASAPFFSKSMEGGQLIVREITLNEFLPGGIQLSSNKPTFSANIIEIIDSTRAKIDNTFIYTSNNITFDKFVNQINFTASYIDTPSLTQTIASESFATIDLKKLTPVAGYIDKISIKYKPVGSFGDYLDAGEYNIQEKKNLLTDRLRYQITDIEGFIEKPIGFPENQADISNYWISGSSSGTISLTYNRNENPKGIVINFTTGSGYSEYDFGFIQTKNQYYFECCENTEYILEFDCLGTWDTTTKRMPQLDVYVSGSSITSNIINEPNIPINRTLSSFGNRIGIITNNRESRKTVKIKFKSLEDGYLTYTFIIRSGQWNISNIKVYPNNSEGNTPNQYRFNIPISKFEIQSDLTILVEYYNRINKKSNIDSKIFGVYFSGSSNPFDMTPFIRKDQFNAYTSSISSSLAVINRKILYHPININYIGNLRGAGTQPKLLETITFADSLEIDRIYLQISSSNPWGKINFYITTGSIYDTYLPWEEYRFPKMIATFETFSPTPINFTSSVHTGPTFKIATSNGYSTMNIFASASGLNQPNNQTRTTLNIITKKV